ncbi:HET-domain-containing protein [Paraphaeosphaeria sporulosa]|uniref:HET-domain-containing protein n=1 Tax=Paraphaeosphaeria sporulosa TaxID=1460663 RepID=A0A177BVX0_9PLEO|nr:HET-domain-containing protein [Paraphaeosphaeria sporulosa]OAF98506.1 HET-domain-containing protein [Paraphaeosphaeria sporulosa]
MQRKPTYSRLTKKCEFRLLILHPGEDEQDIQCELAHSLLHKRPQFDALSYEWGAQPGSTEISCNAQLTFVTNNLHAALQSLRLPDKQRVLWVDALCINQADKEEKSHQIAMMQQIYSSATRVLIWLGKETQLVRAAFEIMKPLALLWLDRATKGVDEMNYLAARIFQRPKNKSILGTITDCFHFSYDLKLYDLQRKIECSDDEIFKFCDADIWQTIDNIFQNTYFQRCWIVQEVAVADVPYVVYGNLHMPWEVFRNAHYGRRLIAFVGQKSYEDGPLTCVEDARKRFRNPMTSTDLASALATFTYAHQSCEQDHVYAALGLVKTGSIISPDYTKTPQQVFLEAATCIIRDRKDLYLLGNKTLFAKRTMPDIPTWVPEWTGPTTESSTEHYSHNLSQCIDGKIEIQDRSLFVNALLLDSIERVYPIADDEMILQAFSGIKEEFEKADISLFDAYVADNRRGSASASPKCSIDSWIDNLGQVFALITRLPRVPQLLLEIFRDFGRFTPHELDGTTLNIESLWSAMVPQSSLRPRTEAPICEKLFLAVQVIFSLTNTSRTGVMHTKGLPKGYGPWMLAATLIAHTEISLTPAFREIYSKHALRSNTEDECIFITSSGYLGRAPYPAISKGQIITILGGGYVPYVLERHDNHYKLISHAYVEGVMHLQRIPDDMTMERLEIR